MNQSWGVREHLQQEYRLKVLRIWLDYSGHQDDVVFSFRSGTGEDDALLSAPVGDLGLPSISEARSDTEPGAGEPTYRIPEHILNTLDHLVKNSDPPGSALWLRLSPPVGLLPAVPWEELLQPRLQVPVLRLPFQIVAPKAPDSELDAVVCFSSPVSDAQLQRDLAWQFINQIPADLAGHTRFHLFADLAVYEELRSIQARFGNEYEIHVYDPRRVETPSAPKRRREAGVNPWLSWMQEALGGRSADLVHFVCHCYSLRAEGALALAESPTRSERWESATMLAAADLTEFLNACGAWSLAFSSPPTNHSAAGMRLLQDSVARSRPGPVLLHQIAHADGPRALGEAYRFLFAQGYPAPASPAITLYCHPFREHGAQADVHGEGLLHQFTLAGKLGDRLKSSNQPAWLAASQRTLEASCGDLAAAVEADPGSGRKRARDLVLEALAEYAANPEAADPAKDS